MQHIGALGSSLQPLPWLTAAVVEVRVAWTLASQLAGGRELVKTNRVRARGMHDSTREIVACLYCTMSDYDADARHAQLKVWRSSSDAHSEESPALTHTHRRAA